MHMRILSIIIAIVFNTVCKAAIENFPYTLIDGNNGLSGNQVRNITQLPDGRMMITTEGLVNIYDGTTFKYLHYTNTNSIKLSGYSGFHHDYVDNNGYMWLKNQHRLYLIDINRERFTDNPAAILKRMGFSGSLRDFFMDQDKNLWLISESDDLFYLDDKQKEQLFLKKVSGITGKNDQIYDLAVLDKKLYLFYRSGALICLDLKSKKELYRQNPCPYSAEDKYAATSFVMADKNRFLQLKNGRDGGLMLAYDTETKKWIKILETRYWLNYLSIDRREDIWVTCKEGLWHVNALLSKKEFIPQLKMVDGQLINTEVSTIYHDNQGGMWLGTLNRGLLYYHPDRFKFKNIGKGFFDIKNNATISVTCFTEGNDGQILVGTQQGLYRYHSKSGTMERFNLLKGNIHCKAFLRDRKNRLWIATTGNGLICIKQDGRLKQFFKVPKTVYSLLENPDGSLLLATDQAGFGNFSPETGEYKQSGTNPANTCGSVFQMAAYDAIHLVGICSNGFFIYNRRSGKVALYPGSHNYNAIIVDSRKQIWLGSKDGLQVWDLHKGLQNTFYTDQGLVNNQIQSIAEASGAIWVATSSGLSRLHIQKNNSYSFANFNRVDGVITNEFCERSVYISKNGNMFWGGLDGFNELPARKALNNKQNTAPLFVNFLLFNRKVESGIEYDGNTLLKKPLSITKEITLNYDQNFISLEFTSLNYINPTQTYYRYQLSNVDRNEQEIQSADGRGRATYTNLQPGTYYFKVRSANNSKDWTENYSEIKITVKAPFWKTTLAYCIYTLLLSAITASGMRFYLKRKRLKLVREQKEKLNQMKATFFDNIKEELNQPLNQIISPLDSILKHTDEGRIKLQLKEIQNNAMDLKELVEQLSKSVLSPLPPDESALNMEVLMLNMRKLLEHQKERKENNISERADSGTTNGAMLSLQDEKLIQRALKYVEENLDNANYSVELLSKDMGMDRTGLYRKLVHVVGKTPTTFIRSVRLKRAAVLLDQGLTVAEVADRVGFSTSSYLTKCFQEEFGMKPSQYIESLRQGKKARIR